jgi:hypothetical protein
LLLLPLNISERAFSAVIRLWLEENTEDSLSAGTSYFIL